MGACAGKHSYDERKAAAPTAVVPTDATASVYTNGSSKHTPGEKQHIPAGLLESSYDDDCIPAGPAADDMTTDDSPLEGVPLPLSKAPAGLRRRGRPQLPYAAPYIPPPSLPPPEYPTLPPTNQGWAPRRRRALLIGCNYARGGSSAPGTQLRGSVNDVHCLLHLLISKYGFHSDSIVLLHDDQTHEEYWPTKANILAGVRWLLHGSGQADSLVFAFSGHGALDVAPHLAHSHNGRDGILPCDHEQAGAIHDDQLHAALVGPLPAGARLHAFVDACRGVFALGLPSCVYTRADGWSNWEEDEGLHHPGEEAPRVQSRGGGGEVVMLSSTLAEEDEDLEPAAYSAYDSTGAVTFSLVQAVEQGQASTYNVLLRAMRYSLKNGPQHFPKVPELSASADFDLNRPFLL